MVYSSSAKTLPDIIDEISNGLIASGLWHNVDTTWNTTDRTGNNARRVIAYGTAGASGKGNTTLSAAIAAGVTAIPVTSEANFNVGDRVVIGTGSIAEVRDITSVAAGLLTISAAINTAHAVGEAVRELDLEIYAALEAINQTNGINYFYSGAWYYAKGLRIVFSATWDAAAHAYPSSNQSTFIPINGNSANAGAGADLATLSITYYLWYDASGFVIMGKPEPHSDAIQHSFFTAVERNPNKEYADGYTNFYCMVATNYWPNGYYDGTNQTSINRNRGILRPFAYQYPDGGGVVNFSVNGNGISFVPMPSYLAFKSSGNGKVYYVKPILNNQNNQLAPIFQAELWFPWSETVGLIDGDVVAVEGTTTKYLCKSLDSPKSTNRLTYAIKYVA